MNRRLLRNRLAVLAFLVILGAAATAFLAPHLPLGDPDAVDTPNRLRPPLTAGHWLGTDEFGRALLARLIWGARVSPLAGAATAGAAMLVGLVLGPVVGLSSSGTLRLVTLPRHSHRACPCLCLA